MALRDINYGDQRIAWERLKVAASLRLATAVSAGSQQLAGIAEAHMRARAGHGRPPALGTEAGPPANRIAGRPFRRHAGPRVHVAPLGVDLGLFSPLPASAAADSRDESLTQFREDANPARASTTPGPRPATASASYSHSPRLLHVGALTPVKDHALLLRALASVRRQGVPAMLELVGDGPLRPGLERLAHDLDLEPNVRFRGAVDHAALPDVYRAADACVVSSRHEAQCMAAIEAAACGVPVVGTRVGVLPELTTALAPVGDTGALADAIVTTLTGRVSALTPHSDARGAVPSRVRDTYGLEACADRFLRALHRAGRHMTSPRPLGSPGRASPAAAQRRRPNSLAGPRSAAGPSHHSLSCLAPPDDARVTSTRSATRLATYCALARRTTAACIPCDRSPGVALLHPREAHSRFRGRFSRLRAAPPQVRCDVIPLTSRAQAQGSSPSATLSAPPSRSDSPAQAEPLRGTQTTLPPSSTHTAPPPSTFDRLTFFVLACLAATAGLGDIAPATPGATLVLNSVRALVPLVILLALGNALRSRRWPRFPRALARPSAVWLAVLVASTVGAARFQPEAIASLMRPASGLLLAWAVYDLCPTPGRWRRLTLALALGGLATALVGLAEATRLRPASDWIAVLHNGQIPIGDVPRVAATLSHPNEAAMFLELSLPLLIVLAWTSSPPWRSLWTLAALATLLAVVLTFSRAGLVAAVTALGVLILVASRRHALTQLVLLGVVGLAFPLALAWGFVMDPGLDHRLVAGLDESSVHQPARTAFWAAAVAMVRDHPLLGVGPDNFAGSSTPTQTQSPTTTWASMPTIST